MNSLERILAEALELGEKERASLAARLLDSLDDEPEQDAEEAWKQETERRIDELEANPSNTIPWEDVKKRLDERLGAGPEQPPR